MKKPKPNENKQKTLEKPIKPLCRLCCYSLPCSDLPKVRPWWPHAGFHNKLIGSFCLGCKSSLSHFALWLPKVHLRHSRAALLLGVSTNAFPLLGLGGRHTEGEASSPRTANLNASWTLNEPPLKSYYPARHCSLFLTFYELGSMHVPVCPLWTDLLPGKK